MKTLEQAFNDRNKKLNKIEKLKKSRKPQEAFSKIEEYAKNGYDSIPKEDLDFFLKSYGIYKRKKPNSMMMRIRIPNGKLVSYQAETIGELAKRYGNDYMDITTRMQIQLRYLKIEDIPKILENLDSIGISPFQTGVDNIRNIVTDPLNSVAKDSLISTDDIVEKIQNIFLKNKDWISVLPRKFNIGFNGSFSNRANIFGHDLGFALAQKDGEFGFNIYLGGKVGVTAKKSNFFVKTDDEIIEFFTVLINIFKDYGFRDNRNKNRLHFLIQAVGLENFENAIREKSYMNFKTAGITLVSLEPLNTEFIELKNGKFAKLVIVPSGLFSGSDLIEAGKVAEKFGGEIRFSYQQNVYIVGVEKNTPFSKYDNFNSPYFQNMVACAGIEDCPFGVIPNKPDAIEMANYLQSHIPISADSQVSFHWSACPKGCGIHGFGDIGFEGAKVKVDGKMEFGVHILLGGKLSGEGKEGHKVLRSIPLVDSKYYVEELMVIYKNLKKDGESFSKFEDRVFSKYSTGALEFVLRLSQKFPLLSENLISENPKSSKNEVFEIFDFGVKIYHKISGENPYSQVNNFTSTLRHFPPILKVSFGKILSKMVERDFSKRYQVFSEITVDLESL